VNDGPPPVPGGRSPEEREAARRAREARRAGGGGEPPPPPAPETRDWLAEAEALTRSPVAETAAAGDGRGGRIRSRAQAVGGSRPRRARLVALAAVVAVAIGVAWFAVSLFQPFKGDGDGEVGVVIPTGASLGEIADLLESKGVVSSSSFFQLRARLAGRSDELKPGRYTLARDMSFMAVLDRLEQGLPPNVVQIAIPEGLSRAEVAPRVKRLEGNYINATRRNPNLNPRDYKAKGAKSLEGFLFPATYELKKGQRVRKLVDEQLTTFKRNFDTVDLRYARSKNLTPYDVLTIASLIEREAAVPKERPIIASVIYNRLHEGIPLGIDATIRFATGNWSSPLTKSELAIDSPYNTRTRAGLPPGPIGNPGLASIEAAARPARVGYLYYVVKPGTCGEHIFSTTFAQFQRDQRRYQEARDRAGGRSPTSC
jgi:peptidoglycan lytic transglycosylase G